MGIKTVSLDESTPPQRKAFVTDFLNLDLPADADEATIRAAIDKSQPGVAHIFVNEEETPAPPPETEPLPPELLAPEEQAGRLSGSLGQGDPRCLIQIPIVETEDSSGSQDVLVGVNGRAWQLKRGVDLDVPYRVVLALDLAVADQVRHSNEEGHEGEVIVTQTKRFNYVPMRMPSPQAIKEWHQRTDAEFCA